MKYFLIAGEASGDLHASQLIKSLRAVDSQAEFAFLGGDMMAEATGVAPIVHYKSMAYMGFVDVLLHLKSVLGNLSKAKSSLKALMPDALILIDYPSFNLRIAKYAYGLNIPVYYYISPKVWAWKEHRVKDIRKYVRQVFSILPFEVDFYRKHGMQIMYVGNPTLNEVDEKLSHIISEEDFRSKNDLSSEPVLALVPGSRISEIKSNLPYMVKAAENLKGVHLTVIAAAPGIDSSIYDEIAPEVKRITGQTFELMNYACAALVTSGTATLETALLGTPQVVVYRAVGSKFVYNVFKHILKVKFVSLPNLIANRDIVKELLLHLCTVKNISENLNDIWLGGEKREAMIRDYEELRSLLGTSDAPMLTAQTIYSELTDNV
ncbi:MAG: lipid-A-disaccharide synthase [Bacteroidales bacterium]|nr:lipid-A-disaccharide synthase [Bacteroidales bacterium]